MSGSDIKIKGVSPALIVIVGSFILLAAFIFLQPEHKEVNQKALPWNAQFNEQGQLEALGITLQQTTLREAMEVFGKDVEIKLFTNKEGGDKKVEAYFTVIYIGAIKASIAVNLDVSDAELETVYNRGAKISPITSGGREVKLSSEDNLNFLEKRIENITLIPRKNLDERSIEMRFGEADRRAIGVDGLERLYFNRMGLEMILDPDGPEALQYSVKQSTN